MLRHLLFDLDETLYSSETGLWPVIGQRITLYIHERLGFPLEAAAELRARYAREYGISLIGLMENQHVDPDDYLAFVHDIPLAQYLRPDPPLDAMLTRLPLPKAVLTNSDAAHARRVLSCLGIAHHFPTVIDIRALGFVNKPKPEAYQRALKQVGAAGAECLFVDDLPQNLAAAHAEGLITVWVRAPERAPDIPPEGVDYQVASVLGVERIVAGLIGQA